MSNRLEDVLSGKEDNYIIIMEEARSREMQVSNNKSHAKGIIQNTRNWESYDYIPSGN